MRAKVITPHYSNYPNPITFKQGDPLELGEMDTQFPGWIRTKTCDGNIGWAPVQYIQQDASQTTALAKCDYDATELNTTLGEELEVLQELNQWFRVKNSAQQEGWVPVESVILI